MAAMTLEGLFEDADKALQAGLDALVRFVCTKVRPWQASLPQMLDNSHPQPALPSSASTRSWPALQMLKAYPCLCPCTVLIMGRRPLASISIKQTVSLGMRTRVWGADTPGPAAQAVFCDLRVPVLEDMYRHSVARARADPILSDLDAILAELATRCNSALARPLAAGLLAATVDAFMRVLLDGGPHRCACSRSACVLIISQLTSCSTTGPGPWTE